MTTPTTQYPNSPDAETGFLGAVLASDGATLEEHPVTPEHFLQPANRLIAATCISLFNTKQPVNALTVTTQLREHDALDRVGGPFAISSLFGPLSMAAHYHGVLCDLLARRRIVDGAAWALNAAPSTDTADKLKSGLLDRISGIEVSSEERNEVPSASAAIERRLDKIERGETVTGIKTGNDAWNRAFGGLGDGSYYALAGRPGTGKSAMMEEMISDMIANEMPVLVFQRDMSPQKMIERICCRWCGVQYWRYVRGMLSRDEIQKIRETVRGLQEAPLFLYNPVGLTAEKLCSIMRREKRIHGVQAGFLDHIQALKVGKDFREGLTQASLAIRGCVTELDIPFVTLCHLNREGGKGERPSANNIKEFDQLFGDVDGMAILWSEPVKEERKPTDQTIVNFYVAKNRDGPESEEKIVFDGAMLRFLGRAAVQ